ncbi:hypothetical protein [Natrialba swarupiae]|uniref:Uncharacterized protein n=1 Tax=Natrialba swarupiae TaxID=2448032 RepID=A0A5D5AJA0_9EURY|nr:hypothetical protein [Natrialba swarupiae]TYT61234.1 hypothetical protein FYC77_14320 [Natrialba swarupiae]
MGEATVSSDPDELVDRINELAASGPSTDGKQSPVKQFALELVLQYHDRINERYYERGRSDVEAEARTLDEAGLSTAGIVLAMSATGRPDVSERMVTACLE